MKLTLNPAPLELLSTDECLRLLELRQVGRIAVVLGGRPEILPMTYCLFQGTLIVRSVYDLDLDVVHGQLVAFEVGDTDGGAHRGWSVVVHGHAECIQGGQERADRQELPSRPWAVEDREHCLRILPVSITGRRIGHDRAHSISLAGTPDTWHG